MKTLKLIAAGIILLVTAATQAQVSVNVNIGSPPVWGPAGYSNVDFYYLPDIHSYYDIRQSQFIYFGNGKWIRSRQLPRQYRNYDLYQGYKVVLNDYRGRTPYVNYKFHKTKYYVGYKGKPQKNIGPRPNNKNDFKQKPGNHNQGHGHGKGHGKNH